MFRVIVTSIIIGVVGGYYLLLSNGRFVAPINKNETKIGRRTSLINHFPPKVKIDEKKVLMEKVKLGQSWAQDRLLTPYQREILIRDIADLKKYPPRKLKKCLKEKERLKKTNDCFNTLIKEKLIAADIYFSDKKINEFPSEVLFLKMLGKIISGNLIREMKNFQNITSELKQRGVESFEVEKWDTLLTIGESENIESEDIGEIIDSLQDRFGMEKNKSEGFQDFIKDLEVLKLYLANESSFNKQDGPRNESFRELYLKAMLDFKAGDLEKVEEDLKYVIENEGTKNKTYEVAKLALRIIKIKGDKATKLEKLGQILNPVFEVDLNLMDFLGSFET